MKKHLVSLLIKHNFNMISTNPKVIVSSYGLFYPVGGINTRIISPVRTEVDKEPTQSLVTLDKARDWVGMEGEEGTDPDLEDLIKSSTNLLCGPNSKTSKCFRKWRLIDVYRMNCNILNKYTRVFLSYPIVQSIEEIKIVDISGVENVLPSNVYALRKNGLKKSCFVLLEDVDLSNLDNKLNLDFEIELQIKYNCSSRLSVDGEPVIDDRLIQAVKHLINEGYYKRSTHLGPYEGAGAPNKYFNNLIKHFLY